MSEFTAAKSKDSYFGVGLNLPYGRRFCNPAVLAPNIKHANCHGGGLRICGAKDGVQVGFSSDQPLD